MTHQEERAFLKMPKRIHVRIHRDGHVKFPDKGQDPSDKEQLQGSKTGKSVHYHNGIPEHFGIFCQKT